MLKEKRYIIVLIAIMVAIIMLKPNFSNAATEYKYSDTEQGIEWAYELDENNNTRTKKFNVYGDAATNPVTRVSGGYDLVVSKIVANKQDIAVGDQLVFTATITNA